MSRINSKTNRINFEYLKLWQEIFFALKLIITKKRRGKNTNGTILIVVPCLIGEFAATIPALFDFIQRHREKRVDILVSPAVKDLAEKISGIGRVFLADSIFGRSPETPDYGQPTETYEKIIVLRISRSAIRIINNLEYGEIETVLLPSLGYVVHLAINLIQGKTPRRWKTFNFEVLGGKDCIVSFDKIFNFSEVDSYRFISESNDILSEKKTIIFHTGTNWPMKHWDLEKWVELLKKINKIDNFRFICVGGREDNENWKYISTRLKFPMESLINKTSIHKLALVIRKADFFIGIDSGPANIAHLVNTRSIVLYGPGPHMFMSDHPDDIVIDKSKGRGLWHMYFSVKNSYISRISVEEVFDAFQRLYTDRKKKTGEV